jgi:hypothetical protein
MPKIQWTNLPPALRQHLFDRLEERQITGEDLYKLKLWRESEPDAPDGLWYKDFESFKICGEGKFPTVLPIAAEMVSPAQRFRFGKGRVRSANIDFAMLGSPHFLKPIMPVISFSSGIAGFSSGLRYPAKSASFYLYTSRRCPMRITRIKSTSL